MNPDYFLIEQFCNAGVNNIDYAIPPEASPDNTIVTLEKGFPPLMEIKPNEGGVPVPRQGFNGILRALSNIIAYQNKGGLFTFNPENVAGYNTGAVLWNPATDQFVKSLKDANTDNYIEFPQFIDGQSWEFVSENSVTLPYATTLIAGIIKIATQQMVDDGTDNTTVVTPLTLANAISHIDLSLYAKLLSPLFQGNPRAPTPRYGDSSNSIATTEFVSGIYDFGAGYIVFPNGFAIQWGTTQIPPNYDSLEVPLPLRYDIGFACANAITQTGANPVGTRFKDATYEKLILSNGAPNTSTATWITIGYFSNSIPTGFDFQRVAGLGAGYNPGDFYYNKLLNTFLYSSTAFLDTASWNRYAGNVTISSKKVYNPNDAVNNIICTIGNAIYGSSESSQGTAWSILTSGVVGVGIDINTDKGASTIVVGNLRSGDDGNTWTESTGIQQTIYAVRYMGKFNNKYYWLSYQGGAGIAYISDDDAVSWKPTALPFNYNINTNFGSNTPMAWGDINATIKFNVPSMANFVSWAGTDTTLYSTADNGNSWQLVTTPFKVKLATGFFSPFTGKYVYIILCTNGTVYSSPDLIVWTSTGIINIQMAYACSMIDAGGILVISGCVESFGAGAIAWASKDGINFYTTNLAAAGRYTTSMAYCEYSRCLYVANDGYTYYSYVPLP